MKVVYTALKNSNRLESASVLRGFPLNGKRLKRACTYHDCNAQKLLFRMLSHKVRFLTHTQQLQLLFTA